MHIHSLNKSTGYALMAGGLEAGHDALSEFFLLVSNCHRHPKEDIIPGLAACILDRYPDAARVGKDWGDLGSQERIRFVRMRPREQWAMLTDLHQRQQLIEYLILVALLCNAIAPSRAPTASNSGVLK